VVHHAQQCLGLSYAESFQPASNASVDPLKSYKPTEGKQWELGIKYQPPGSSTLLSAAIYDLTQKNVLVTSTGSSGTPVTDQT
ncbi:TonB-dependent receptor domain-containing protein, partial [Klebsiella variicola]|uniref:TonB-dependent receptor domain-containing protein n=1 Tax=Klebsiella variicola TaxID=244366 RepID=UPI00273018B3